MRIHQCTLKLSLFSDLIEPLLLEESSYLQQLGVWFLSADMMIKVLKFHTTRVAHTSFTFFIMNEP